MADEQYQRLRDEIQRLRDEQQRLRDEQEYLRRETASRNDGQHNGTGETLPHTITQTGAASRKASLHRPIKARKKQKQQNNRP
jgi:hypothetical protein